MIEHCADMFTSISSSSVRIYVFHYTNEMSIDQYYIQKHSLKSSLQPNPGQQERK